MSEKSDLGILGEEIAARYLIDKGYQILERRYKRSYYEIDIICKKANQIIFAEVKTRNSDYFGNPENAVDRIKEINMEKAVSFYLEEKNVKSEIRFDIISVLMSEPCVKIHHIEDAFFPGLSEGPE